MIKKISMIALSLSLLGCGNSKTEQAPAAENKADSAAAPEAKMNELADFEFHTLVINIPSPFEVIPKLAECGIPYNEELLNTTDKAGNYSTSTKKALNYGGYLSDLVYLTSNERFSQVKNYMKTCQSLAKALDCADSFNKVAGTSPDHEMTNKDSLNQIVDRVYGEMDLYLRNNDRLLAATQILVGSWIESQYITSSLLRSETKTSKNEILFKKVKEQKFTSEKLVELLKEFEKEKEMKSIIAGVKDLDKIYGEMTGDQISAPVLEKLNSKLAEVRKAMQN